jgi:hypothetical protein
MFYLLKNLLLLILVIFKLKCYKLILNEIMVLNALYVCLHAFSLRRESLDPDPERRTPHFLGGSVTLPLHRGGLRCCHASCGSGPHLPTGEDSGAAMCHAVLYVPQDLGIKKGTPTCFQGTLAIVVDACKTCRQVASL